METESNFPPAAFIFTWLAAAGGGAVPMMTDRMSKNDKTKSTKKTSVGMWKWSESGGQSMSFQDIFSGLSKNSAARFCLNMKFSGNHFLSEYDYEITEKTSTPHLCFPKFT